MQILVDSLSCRMRSLNRPARERGSAFLSCEHVFRVIFSGSMEYLSAQKKKCVPALKKKLFIKLDEEANCIFLIKIFG